VSASIADDLSFVTRQQNAILLALDERDRQKVAIVKGV